MSGNVAIKKKILFVDDDQTFLELIESLFALWSKGTWEIFLAHNTGTALSILQEQPIDLVVSDMNMPVVDGLQFLRLLQRMYPKTPKAALTGTEDPNCRKEFLANGAELFLNKPASVDGLEGVYAALNELMDMHSQEEFRGGPRRVRLPEVIQLECFGVKSSILEVSGQGLRGVISAFKAGTCPGQPGALGL